MNAIIAAPVHLVQTVYSGTLNSLPNAPIHLVQRAYAGALNSTIDGAIGHFKSRQDFIHSLEFQICTSTTLKDDAVINPWAVYPSGKLCLEVPWFYPFGCVLVILILILLIKLFEQFLSDLFTGVLWLLKSCIQLIFGLIKQKTHGKRCDVR